MLIRLKEEYQSDKMMTALQTIAKELFEEQVYTRSRLVGESKQARSEVEQKINNGDNNNERVLETDVDESSRHGHGRFKLKKKKKTFFAIDVIYSL